MDQQAVGLDAAAGDQVDDALGQAGLDAAAPACASTVCGTIDAALSTKVLPVVMQNGSIQPIGIMAGKLYGAMPTNTPSGSR